MWIIGVIALLVVRAIVGTTLGQVWGPLLLAVGFAGWGCCCWCRASGIPSRWLASHT